MKDRELIRIVEYVERTRGPFQALFPESPGDPFWTVAAFLVRAQVRGEAVSQSTLAQVAGMPHSSAVRHIEGWIARGLIERRPRGPKSFSLHASPDLVERFTAYAKHTIKELVDYMRSNHGFSAR